MTLFSEDIYSRKLERLMTTVPNFKPRGVGFRFSEPQIFIAVTATPAEILSAKPTALFLSAVVLA